MGGCIKNGGRGFDGRANIKRPFNNAATSSSSSSSSWSFYFSPPRSYAKEGGASIVEKGSINLGAQRLHERTARASEK